MSAKRSARWSAEVEAVYRQEARQLWALLYAHCGDADRAYDAVQEAFFRLQKHTGEEIREKRAWLLRVGKNWLHDVARRKASGVRSSENMDVLPGTSVEPQAATLNAELRQQVRDILAELREDDRAVLVLRYGLGWSSQRIAGVLEASASAVDMRLSRARKRMAELLEKAGIDHG